jgi:Asp-tRNA(Asn)/Glu-tRNA(Gln) amidotransferase A subunit family amidase
MGKSRQAGAMGRRKFIKAAAATAATSSLARLAQAQNKPPQTRPGQSQAPRPQSRPALPPLGNAEPPAMQFQAYHGGTGALLQKIVRENGASAFDRVAIDVEPWTGDIPKSEEDVVFQPVHRLAALVKARHISPSELTRIYLDRLKRLDPVMLCAVSILEGPAREAAQQADEEIRTGQYRGPLHGIPYGLKDLFSVKGTLTTWGAREFRERRIEEDSEIAVRLRDAGAILIAKLSTGRFAINDQWFRGRTNNPWNLKQGSSGSSAGVASATAAGCVAFGIGTETRGSIISPTVRCGICALRPTFGRVSRYGGMVLAWTMDRAGPMCRSSEDCALVFNAIHGVDEKDPSTVTTPFRFERKPDLSKLRIGYDSRAPKEFVDKIRELGADPKPIGERPDTRGIDTLEPESTAAFDGFFSSGMLQDVDNPNGTPGSGRFTRGRNWTAKDFLQAQRRREILVQRMAELMKDFDMYLVAGTGDIELCSYTGNPVAVLPYTFKEGENGQPVCAGIIGDVFADDKILSVATAYQRVTDWHMRRPNPGA